MILQHFGASRFKNGIQAKLVRDLEEKYGIETLTECADWAAKKGMSLGQGLSSIETAIKNWGKPRSPAPPGAPVPAGEDPVERARIDKIMEAVP